MGNGYVRSTIQFSAREHIPINYEYLLVLLGNQIDRLHLIVRIGSIGDLRFKRRIDSCYAQ